MLSIIWAIIILSILILAHELGHFIVAKAADIKIHEFSIGMGPLIFSRQKGETQYSIRALPIGGYNRMAGEEPGEEDDPRGFNKKSVGVRMAVISAGSIMNFLLGVSFFIIIFMMIGVPADIPEIGTVVEGAPAERAGFRPGDKVLAINDQKINSWIDMVEIINNNAEKELSFAVERDGEIITLQVTPYLDEESGVGLIGVTQPVQKTGLLEAIYLGFKEAITLIIFVLRYLVQMIAGTVAAEVAGPVGIVQMIGQAASFGLASLLSFSGILSVQLGLFNLLPIPALDGSRLIFLALEGIRRKPVDPQKEGLVHLIGFALLMGLMILVTYQDVMRLFNP